MSHNPQEVTMFQASNANSLRGCVNEFCCATFWTDWTKTHNCQDDTQDSHGYSESDCSLSCLWGKLFWTQKQCWKADTKGQDYWWQPAADRHTNHITTGLTWHALSTQSQLSGLHVRSASYVFLGCQFDAHIVCSSIINEWFLWAQAWRL